MTDGRIHFIGIGGAGMSAIATVLLEQGIPVSGSDLKSSRHTRALTALGADIHVGHDAAHVAGASRVVVSTAIPERNPEYIAAVEAGIPVLRRAEALGALAAGMHFVAIAGTHGKTTTSSMVTLALDSAGMDPTFVVGGELNDIGANARSGSGGYFVAEADESDASFLSLSPQVVVITNIETDHLDHYADRAAIDAAFLAFMLKVGESGTVIVCADDEPLLVLARSTGLKVLAYGTGDRGDIGLPYLAMQRVVLTPGGADFAVALPDGRVVEVALQVPGVHNALNAVAALAVAFDLDLELPRAIAGLGRFSGVKRRFQQIALIDGVRIIDDYAHHPTEVRATLAAARTYAPQRLVAVFQPHRYSRTQHMAVDFGVAFRDADLVVVTDVYAAGEEPMPGVSGKLLVDAIIDNHPDKPVAYIPRRDGLVDFLSGTLHDGDMVLTMGAGDIGTLGEELAARLSAEDPHGATRSQQP